MTFADYFDKIDIYEVEKADYEAYFFRLPKNEILKTTPQENYIVYVDATSADREPICGIEEQDIMGTKARRFFIFNLLDEERLGEHKRIQVIHMSEEEYINFLTKAASSKKEAPSNG